MRYEYLLFDLDHTLLDSNASEAAAYDHTMRSVGVDDPAAHFQRYSRINRALWAEVETGRIQPDDVRTTRFAELITEIGIDADPEAMGRTFVTGLGTNGELYPGAIELLDHLTARFTLAMVTNGIGEVQRNRIERLGIGHYFDAIAISGELGTAKPGAAIFDLTFEQLGRPAKSAALMIGDSLTSDIAGGANYGIGTCWYNPHGQVAGPKVRINHTITALTELIDLVA